jgi:NitT/TauT family transport system substrate-binding protein
MPFPTESNGAEAVIEREDDMLKMISTVLLAGLLSVVASVQGYAQQTTKLRLALVPAAPSLAVWVAQDKGFFAAQHLDVAITPMTNVALIPAVLGNQFDIGIATTVDLIKAAAGGMNVVAIAANHFETDQAATNALVVRKDSGIRSAKDLAGKTVATPSIGAILQVATLYWIKKEGVDPNRVHFVEVPFPTMGDQMAARTVDAAIAAEPFASRMVAAGNTSLGNALLQVANPSLATLWMSDRSWAQANQATVAKWTAALREAANFITQDPKAARAILAQYTKLPPPVVDQLALPHFETKLQKSDLDAWIKVLRELGQVQGPIDSGALLAGAQ